MAFLWNNAMLLVDGVNLSGSIQSLALAYEAESLDGTKMGDASRVMQGGLKGGGVDVTFFQKFTCVDATLFGIVGCQVCMEMRACNACASACTNIRYQGTYLLQSYPPMGGAVGSLLTAAVRFEPAGDLSRNTAAT